jgi:hypothetical protein
MVVLRRSGKYAFSGPDPSYWLGGGEGYPNPIIPDSPRSARIRTTAASITTWLNAIYPLHGITLGTITNGNTSTGAIPYPSPGREALDDLCTLTGTEWRIRPDFTLDVGPTNTLYPATPTVILTNEKASTEGTLRSLEATSINVDIDASRVADAAIGYGRGTDTNATPTVRRRTHTPTGNVRNVLPGGGTPDLTILADLPNVTASGLNAALDQLLTDYRQPFTSIRATARAYNPLTYLTPGQRIYAWHPLEGVYDLTTQIEHRGQIAFPQIQRLASITAPVTSDNGVYVLLNDGATIIDLTPWVEFNDTGDTSLELTPTAREPGAINTSTSINVMGDAGSSNSGRSAQVARAASINSETTDTPTGWTPTLSGIAIGASANSLLRANYRSASGSGLMWIRLFIRLGTSASGASVTGPVTFTLPPGYELDTGDDAGNELYPSKVRISAGGTVTFVGVVGRQNATTLIVFNERADVDDVRVEDLSATNPGTFTNGDFLRVTCVVPVRTL